MLKKFEEEIARELLAIQAVELKPQEPYTWASGLRAPIYTDNRLIMSYPHSRIKIENALVSIIKEKFSNVEVIAGTATAGIPHASIIAHILDLPMIYVRSNAKDHGKQNAIEGKFESGAKVVMVEDLISTGGSVIQAAESVEQAGGKVIGCISIFNYLLTQGKDAFDKVDYPLYSLTNYQALIEVATEKPELMAYKDTLEQWYKNPQAWSEQFTN